MTKIQELIKNLTIEVIENKIESPKSIEEYINKRIEEMNKKDKFKFSFFKNDKDLLNSMFFELLRDKTGKKKIIQILSDTITSYIVVSVEHKKYDDLFKSPDIQN